MPTRAACGSWTGPTKFTEIRSGGWSCASTRRVSQPPTDSAEDVIRAMRSLEQSYLVGVEGVTEVWLVRHADVYDGLDDVHDPPLSPRGREQAGRLAQRMRALPVAAVYASPARRAQETARHLAHDEGYRRPPGGPGTGDRDRGSDARGGRRRRGGASGRPGRDDRPRDRDPQLPGRRAAPRARDAPAISILHRGQHRARPR
ncbi:MAG: histidine phosphatase family protein [Chloroflexi bacterium]|nr:MAG: histidine phosphatase family protein [Chloroflexota bacterium]